jgi:hypothetical protein
MSRVRTYHVSPLRRWLLWIAIGPILAVLLALGLTGDAADRPAFLATAGLVFLILLPFHLIVGSTRLVLSETGVRLRQAGYRLEAGWADIEDLDLTPRREGFVTHEPMAGKGAARLARFRVSPLYDAEQQRLIAERRLIPIDAFAWHLRRGAMREDIERFAPHLAKAVDAR